MLQTEEAGFLEAEGMEKTYKFRQDELAQNVDLNTSKKVCSLKPYDNILHCTHYFVRSLILTCPIMALTPLIIPAMEGKEQHSFVHRV